MIAIDSSVIVAAFASWHAGHAASVAVLERKPAAPAHCLIETYSVLTRLPPPHRAPVAVVAAFLKQAFKEPPLTLPAQAHQRLIQEFAAAGIPGGVIHDALIAATARHHEARLLTRDRRAVVVYERLGADFQLVE